MIATIVKALFGYIWDRFRYARQVESLKERLAKPKQQVDVYEAREDAEKEYIDVSENKELSDESWIEKRRKSNQ